MSMENSAEQGGGRRNPDGFRGRQRSYAKFYTTDVKGFYLRIVLLIVFANHLHMKTAARLSGSFKFNLFSVPVSGSV